MGQYAVRRLLLIPVTLLLMSAVVFWVCSILPGDIALIKLSQGGQVVPDPQKLAELRSNLGLSDPLPVRYATWLKDALQLRLGDSLWTGRAVTEHLREWFPVSVELAFLAWLVSLVVGVPLGTISAVYRGGLIDQIARFSSVVGVTLPTFWSSILVLIALSMLFNWSPPIRYVTLIAHPLDNLQIVFWPAIILGFYSAGFTARVTRSSILEVNRLDYVRTALAKGLNERTVLLRHVMPNALGPVITMSGNQIGHLLGGTVIVETIFNMPGLGRGLINALQQRDFVLVQDVILMTALMVLVINLVVDIAVSWMDPRIRFN